MKSPFKRLTSLISRQRLGKLTGSVFAIFTTISSKHLLKPLLRFLLPAQHKRRSVIGTRHSQQRLRRNWRQGSIKALSFIWLFFLELLIVLNGLPGNAAAVPLNIRYQTNDSGDIVFVSNTVMTCPASDSSCTSAQNGTSTSGQNNNFNMAYVDIDSDSTTFNSSSADLNLPTGTTVLFVGLYWGGDSASTARNQVKLATPTSGGYSTITANSSDVYGGIGYQDAYQGFANVTNQVKNGGNGTYTVANVQSTTGSTNRWGGWSLVIVYRAPNTPPRNLTVFDGFDVVSSSNTNLNITISGFKTPPTGAVKAKLGAIVYDGDDGGGDTNSIYTGDHFKLNGTDLSNAVNPANDVFNSSISYLGNQVTTKNPNYRNQLGYDADIFDASGLIGNNATNATLTLNTGGETYMPGVVTTAIDLYAPTMSINKTVTDINGGDVEIGDILEYTLATTNNKDANGNGDPAINSILTDGIPANTTYVPGSIQIDGAAKTDAAGDDQANYDSTNKQIVYRLGSGANSASGGMLSVSPAAGSSTTVRFRVTINPGTPNGTLVYNQGVMSYNGQTLGSGTSLAANSTAISVTVLNHPDLTITKTHTGNFIRGSTGTYTLIATNSGTATTSGQVTVTDTLPTVPTGLTPKTASGTGWTCTISGQTVTCSRSDALAANSSYPAITLTVNVAANAASSITNTASVSGGGETNTTNDSANDPTTISASPRLTLVKRITAINGNRTKNPNDNTPLNTFVDDPNSTADNDPNWPTPSTYLTGAINGGKVKPGDEVEYTIYFLDNQAPAVNVSICDLVPTYETLVLTGYNTASPHPTESGALPTDTGIALANDANTLPTLPTVYLTNVGDSDRGRYYPPNDSNTPSTCKVLDAQGNATASGSAANTNGAVVVDVVKGTGTANQLPPATAPGTPPNSYGFIRFKAKVN